MRRLLSPSVLVLGGVLALACVVTAAVPLLGPVGPCFKSATVTVTADPSNLCTPACPAGQSCCRYSVEADIDCTNNRTIGCDYCLRIYRQVEQGPPLAGWDDDRPAFTTPGSGFLNRATKDTRGGTIKACQDIDRRKRRTTVQYWDVPCHPV